MKDIVTQDDVPPAGRAGECFWCYAKMGQPHEYGCATIRVPVEVEITIRGSISVPRSWDANTIEFHMNESSNCIDNQIDEIVGYNEEDCACDVAKGKYIRHLDVIEGVKRSRRLELVHNFKELPPSPEDEESQP